jgi:hypothetical protein
MSQESWTVHLIGDERDLSDFARWFPDEPAKVVRDGEYFVLTGELFAGLNEHADVRSAAENEIELMSAAVKLTCGGLSQRPQIGAVFRIDNNGVRTVFAPGCNLGVGVSVEWRVFEDPGQGLTSMQRLVQASKRNKSLHMAMILWADSNRTWPRLYRILEEVEHAFKGRKRKEISLLQHADYERFKHSACHPEIAGVDSRHGTSCREPPKNPMTIREAERFISSLLEQALSQVADV